MVFHKRNSAGPVGHIIDSLAKVISCNANTFCTDLLFRNPPLIRRDNCVYSQQEALGQSDTSQKITGMSGGWENAGCSKAIHVLEHKRNNINMLEKLHSHQHIKKYFQNFTDAQTHQFCNIAIRIKYLNENTLEVVLKVDPIPNDDPVNFGSEAQVYLPPRVVLFPGMGQSITLGIGSDPINCLIGPAVEQ